MLDGLGDLLPDIDSVPRGTSREKLLYLIDAAEAMQKTSKGRLASIGPQARMIATYRRLIRNFAESVTAPQLDEMLDSAIVALQGLKTDMGN